VSYTLLALAYIAVTIYGLKAGGGWNLIPAVVVVPLASLLVGTVEGLVEFGSGLLAITPWSGYMDGLGGLVEEAGRAVLIVLIVGRHLERPDQIVRTALATALIYALVENASVLGFHIMAFSALRGLLWDGDMSVAESVAMIGGNWWFGVVLMLGHLARIVIHITLAVLSAGLLADGKVRHFWAVCALHGGVNILMQFLLGDGEGLDHALNASVAVCGIGLLLGVCLGRPALARIRAAAPG